MEALTRALTEAIGAQNVALQAQTDDAVQARANDVIAIQARTIAAVDRERVRVAEAAAKEESARRYA